MQLWRCVSANRWSISSTFRAVPQMLFESPSIVSSGRKACQHNNVILGHISPIHAPGKSARILVGNVNEDQTYGFCCPERGGTTSKNGLLQHRREHRAGCRKLQRYLEGKDWNFELVMKFGKILGPCILSLRPSFAIEIQISNWTIAHAFKADA